MPRIGQVREQQPEGLNTDPPWLRYPLSRPTHPMRIILPGHTPPTSKTIRLDTAAGQPIDNE